MRGGLIDLFPMGSPLPYRVDLFDDEIESIRTFDADTQRSLYPVPEVRLLPAREFPMDEDARARFRSRWRELLEGDPSRSRIYKDMGNGIATAGIEYYLPLFFDETATVFDYLRRRRHGGAARRARAARSSASGRTPSERYRLVRGDPERPLLPPEALFLNAEQFYGAPSRCAQLADARATAIDGGRYAEFEQLAAASPSMRGADDPLASSRSTSRNDAAPRAACSPRATAGARPCCDFLRASGVEPAGLRFAGGVRSLARREARHRDRRRWRPASRWREAGHRLRHRDRALRRRAAPRAAATRSRSRSATSRR